MIGYKIVWMTTTDETVKLTALLTDIHQALSTSPQRGQ